MEPIDFTDCETDYTANYGGSDRKKGVFYNGKRYMVKMSDRISEEKRNSLNSSYSNSFLSEYIGCHILETMGFDVQKTLIGKIRRTFPDGRTEMYPVVACENFLSEDMQLVEFKFIEGVLLEEKPPRTPKLRHIYEIMTEENEYFTKEFGAKALAAYWDLFIGDALLGNFDRHANNWGYLVHKKTQNISLAPIYDCGSCLYPQMADEAMERILDNCEEIQKRIDVFPQAALILDDGEKASYKRFIASLENKDCNEALLRIMPRIDMKKVFSIIERVEGISDIRRRFYKTMLEERYQQILLEPYRELLRRSKKDKNYQTQFTPYLTKSR